jgi:hypothetical protein
MYIKWSFCAEIWAEIFPYSKEGLSDIVQEKRSISPYQLIFWMQNER